MKTVGIMVMAAAGMLVSSLVFSNTAMAGQIGKSQIRQQKRIHQGVASGELACREVCGLEREQYRIQKSTQQAWSDGALSSEERVRLRCQQGRASAHIYQKKHNDIAR
jgi:hypothetical protein